MIDMQPLTQTAEAVRTYIDANLFDSVGLMMSGIDSHTDKLMVVYLHPST